MKKYILLNWLALAILIAAIAWGAKLNRAHQQHWTDADTQKVLDDTIPHLDDSLQEYEGCLPCVEENRRDSL